MTVLWVGIPDSVAATSWSVEEHVGRRSEDLRLARRHHVCDGGHDDHRDDDHPLVAADDCEVVRDRLLSGAGVRHRRLIVRVLRVQRTFRSIGRRLLHDEGYRAEPCDGTTGLPVRARMWLGSRSSVPRIVPVAPLRQRFCGGRSATSPSRSTPSACWSRVVRPRFPAPCTLRPRSGSTSSHHRARTLGFRALEG